MRLINILRFLKGYVGFTVSGGFRERFINLCAAKGIHIWNVVPEIDKIHAFVSIKSFPKLRSVVRKSGVRLKITRKKGLPLLLKRYRHRAVLMAGILFIIIFYAVMNRFIWFIEVEGTETVSHEEIINVAGNYGVKIGAFSPGIDEIAVGRSAINYFNGRLVWMSVNIKGSKAVIEVRDYIDEHEDTTYGDPCNIVADFDGTVISIETLNGDKEVQPGSAVKKGDLLISGVIQNRDMSASYLEARGKITAQHNLQFTASYACNVSRKKYTDIKEKRTLSFIGIRLPLSFGGDALFSFSESLILGGKKLPLGTIYETEATSAETEAELTLLHAVDAYIHNYYHTFANTNILSCTMIVEASAKGYVISSDMSCIDFMGVKSKIYREE